MEKYTFLLPAYKACFFEEALLSIKNQTYRDFKVIVSDDCSPEELKPIYDKVCGDDPRFTFRRNEENMGSKSLVSHWNLLVDMCDTEWLIMAGDDDVYDPTFLEEMDRLSEKYPKVDLLRTRINKIDKYGDVIWKERPFDEFLEQVEAICQNPDTCVGNYVLRKDTLKKKGGFVNFPYAMGSDTATAIIMSDNGVANVVQPLFSYRISDYQISSHLHNRNVDKEKMRGLFDYHSWQLKYINTVKHDGTKLHQNAIKEYIKQVNSVLVLSSRFYYGALSFSNFMSVYSKLREIGCFERKMEELKFVVGYIKSRRLYK